MTIEGTDWIVILAGLGAIAWVNWYFFVAGRAPALAAVATGSGTAGGPQEQTIVVDGGYSPAIVKVKAGRPVRLVFDRRDNGACSEEVVFPDISVKRFLPYGEKTVVEITPPKAGRYEFTCGMSMLHGAIIAEADQP
jgi:plastocyanin domain-containing protein